MGDIYHSALFTIIAASGAGADAGLPGIRKPRSTQQTELTVAARHGPPITLVTTDNPPHGQAGYTYNTPWASRGWTLQERVFSWCMVTFTEQQVYWSCQEAHWAEETHLETGLARTQWHYALSMLAETMNRLVGYERGPGIDTGDRDKYAGLIAGFGRRKLTNPGDAADAFQGIVGRYARTMGEAMSWGVPCSSFNRALCFRLAPLGESLKRRECLTSVPPASGLNCLVFPSSSCLGWEGVVNFAPAADKE